MSIPPLIGRDEKGNAVYDLSEDQKLAEAGDVAAEKRLETKRLLALTQMAKEQK